MSSSGAVRSISASCGFTSTNTPSSVMAIPSKEARARRWATGGSVRKRGPAGGASRSGPGADGRFDPDGDALRRRVERPLSVDVGTFLEGVRVLAVDDEPDIREVLVRMLERCGAQVTAAASVAEALAEFARERPDVLIADIGMPVEDGYSLIRRVRALGPDGGGNVAAIALTAHGSL